MRGSSCVSFVLGTYQKKKFCTWKTNDATRSADNTLDYHIVDHLHVYVCERLG